MWIYMPQKLHTLLSIAGSDPMGGAGIQADIRVGTSLGLHVLTAITAVTSQNSRCFKSLGCLSPKILSSQLDTIIEDTYPDVIKIGLVGSVANLEIVCDFLKSLSTDIPIVVDPVLKITADKGNLYKDPEIIKVYKEKLFPLVTVITPNLQEIYDLADSDILEFQAIFNQLGVKSMVVKGGHFDKEEIEDLLYTKEEILSYRHPRVSCCNLHGTGCSYSSYLSSYLALGYDLKDAFFKTSRKMQEIIAKSCNYQLGNSIYGPLNINSYIL